MNGFEPNSFEWSDTYQGLLINRLDVNGGIKLLRRILSQKIAEAFERHSDHLAPVLDAGLGEKLL